jgi:hypothetical protein
MEWSPERERVRCRLRGPDRHDRTRDDAWVEASREIPPYLIPDLLRASGERLDRSLDEFDMGGPGVPVAWTGSGLSPVWLDVAREYTERWVHQQQIRDAVGRDGLKERHWMYPVFRTFLLAMPRAYEDTTAPVGTTVTIVVDGPAGGTWHMKRDDVRWRMVKQTTSADGVVRIPQEVAWRLFVRMLQPEEAMVSIERSGPPEMTEPACRAVALMTSST